MKSTDNFKKVIAAELQRRADADPLFAASYAKPTKNIDDCITYILNAVKQSGAVGFSDDEVYGMAAHYYDEDNIDIGKPINARVVVNHSAELTAEEIEAAKKQALEQVMEEERKRIAGLAAKPKPAAKPAPVEQASLF